MVKKEIINLNLIECNWNKKTNDNGELIISGYRGDKVNYSGKCYEIKIKLNGWLPQYIAKFLSDYLQANIKEAENQLQATKDRFRGV